MWLQNKKGLDLGTYVSQRIMLNWLYSHECVNCLSTSKRWTLPSDSFICIRTEGCRARTKELWTQRRHKNETSLTCPVHRTSFILHYLVEIATSTLHLKSSTVGRWGSFWEVVASIAARLQIQRDRGETWTGNLSSMVMKKTIWKWFTV